MTLSFDRTIILKATMAVATLLILISLAACGRNKVRDEDCSEPQKYQSVVAGKRIVVPEGLDPLDEFKEMPIPKSEAEPRADNTKCLESPPVIVTSS